MRHCIDCGCDCVSKGEERCEACNEDHADISRSRDAIRDALASVAECEAHAAHAVDTVAKNTALSHATRFRSRAEREARFIQLSAEAIRDRKFANDDTEIMPYAALASITVGAAS